MAKGFALFETALGPCALIWSRSGIAGVQLPEASPEETRARVLERFPGAREATPPRAARRAMAGVASLLRGEAADLSTVALDMAGVPPFHQRVYELARAIPPGRTLTYGEIAARLGSPGAARAVGQALAHNPFVLVVPCHRVLAAGGGAGGFSARGGVDTKLRLLAIEGVQPEARGRRRAGSGTGQPRAALPLVQGAGSSRAPAPSRPGTTWGPSAPL